MEYVALTGLSERVIAELKQNRLLTIEIRSPHNFFAAMDLKVGEFLFLTRTSADDLTGGTTGIVARLLKHQVVTQRVMQSGDMYYEEREMTTLRLQLDPRCIARIRKVLSNKIGAVSKVDAEEIPLYNAQ
ncbi:DUF473 domain-containing protein [Methanolobus zinderi]|jgi:hypothetical protein|uniref:DUF473 domain-containing protein n=1 Tax=Methanolobus zinderi TaxID=536044 RepID=A0A7D5I7F2_9EURY|nr:DUF473 domain-containing protein [Methanolobus zinderi]KXS43980.1 MAG: hypothetical protein AWU59_798 [Methanolobus sp. T82-4]QLC49042.1 DUF473 domain-containing protein [Methanolobus zinderi]